METPARARSVGVEVCRRMRLCCFARAIGEMLFWVAPARVKNGQTKMSPSILCHCQGTVSDGEGDCLVAEIRCRWRRGLQNLIFGNFIRRVHWFGAADFLGG